MSGKNPLPTQDGQAYEGINIIVPFGGWRFVKSKRDPTSNDKKYPVGTLWINTLLQNIWFQTAAAGNWTQLINSGASLVAVANGGTGDTSLTAHGLLVGEGTSAVAVTAAGTTGQVLIGSTGADPAFGALGLNSGLTNHGVLLAQNNSAFVATTAGTNGQLLIGGTADPAFATVTSAGATIAFTTGNNTLALDVQTGGLTIVDQTSGSVTLAKQTAYMTDNGASLVTYTLPLAANATRGMIYKVVGFGSGGWKIAQNASQTIHFNSSDTTTGAGGSLASTNRYNCVTLMCCNNTGLDFVVTDSEGTLTVV